MSLADEMLSGYEKDITITFIGKKYPLWVLMEKLLRIKTKDGQVVPFILNYQQVELYKAMCEQRRKGKPIRFNILKARQIGFSTFIAGVLFLIGMFTPNIKVGIVADVEGHAKNIFEKYETFYDHLDDSNPNFEYIKQYERANGKRPACSYKPTLSHSRGQTLMKTAKGDSLIEVIVAGEGSGRSTTYNYLHLTEAAFFQNLKVTLNGLLETVSTKDKNSMIFIETTANGMNEYKQRWDKDVAGQTSYVAYFSSWYTNPEYQEDDYIENPQLKPPLMEEWLYRKQEEYKLTNAQIVWYWYKYLDKGDKSIVLQEYPFCPTDAFITSGNALFDPEVTAKRKEEIVRDILPNVVSGQFTYKKQVSEDGEVILLKDSQFNEYRNGVIRIIDKPNPTHHYVITCDPNNGGSDSTGMQVMDNCTCEQVAVFQSNEMPLDKVAYQLVLLGYMYNTALISSEMNLGKVVMDYLMKCHYPKIYVRQDNAMDNYLQSVSTKFGHLTTKATRPIMIDSLKIAFRENPRMIKDYNTLVQMETFQNVEHVDKNGKSTFKIEATQGNHDDLVTSLMAFFLVRNQQEVIARPQSTIEELSHEKKIAMLEHKLENNYRERHEVKSSWERQVGIRF